MKPARCVDPAAGPQQPPPKHHRHRDNRNGEEEVEVASASGGHRGRLGGRVRRVTRKAITSRRLSSEDNSVAVTVISELGRGAKRRRGEADLKAPATLLQRRGNVGGGGPVPLPLIPSPVEGPTPPTQPKPQSPPPSHAPPHKQTGNPRGPSMTRPQQHQHQRHRHRHRDNRNPKEGIDRAGSAVKTAKTFP